jgi:hypothetical protein
MAITKEQAIDILDKFDFFQGQRAGRELWNDKPFEVQEQDIKNFSNDVALLKEYLSDVVPKSEIAAKIFEDIDIQLAFLKRYGNVSKTTDLIFNIIAELKKKYTESNYGGVNESNTDTDIK